MTPSSESIVVIVSSAMVPPSIRIRQITAKGTAGSTAAGPFQDKLTLDLMVSLDRGPVKKGVAVALR
jgi:hypothetical protein